VACVVQIEVAKPTDGMGGEDTPNSIYQVSKKLADCDDQICYK